MENNRIISSLCYFSIFFAGFILPLIVWLVIKDTEVRYHAKSALLSHLLLYVPLLIGGLALVLFGFLNYDSSPPGDLMAIVSIVFVIFIALFSLAIVIWNIYRGIKVLNNEEAA
ncbi:MAG: DUF4870 domain-containing protein [Kurthia sp.]|nr:DUF4870 domain-containing protein [Candidatus Kurthia equi]